MIHSPKGFLGISLWMICLLGLTGCYLEVTFPEGSSPKKRAATPKQTAPPPGRTATMAEISAVGSLSFDHDRVEALTAIARRETLTAEEQIYLIDFSLGNLSFDHYKEKVLQTLIDNPAFTEDAKVHILDNLNRLSFSHHRESVMKAINKRG